MLIRFNNLKIILSVLDGKPGGILGAMLSPYLFSTNMNNFCKRFNEQVKIYDESIYSTVNFFCDVSEKTYNYILKGIPLSSFYIYQLSLNKKFKINFLYDLSLYVLNREKINSYLSAYVIYSILRTFKKHKISIILYKKFLLKKLKIFNESSFNVS